MMLKFESEKLRQKTFCCCFFKCSLSFRAHALQSELNKFSISNFIKFWLQSMSSKITRAFEKTTKFSIKIRLKRTLIRQLKSTLNQCKMYYMKKKTHFFFKNVLLYTINNICLVFEIILSIFSCILKMMSKILFLNLNLTVLHMPTLPTLKTYITMILSGQRWPKG